MRTRRLESRTIVATIAAGLAATLAAVAPFAASAQLVTGLQGASGSAIGPDGAIYVTEGVTGSLTRVDPITGATSTVASGLPPALIPIGGAIDVAFLDGTAYVLVTLVGDPLFGAPFIDGIYRVDGPSSFTLIADLGAWSASHQPDPNDFDFFLVNGVQYALEPFRGGFLVTDGHHNRVLRVSLDGEVNEFATFGNIVPTGLDVRGNTVYLAQAGPVPHDPADGKVVTIDARTDAITEVAAGAPLAVDVEMGLGQSLYVLAQGVYLEGDPGTPALPFTGSLHRVNPDGSLAWLVTGLNLPTSLEFIGNTAYVVTLTGEIWAFPTVSPPPYGSSK